MSISSVKTGAIGDSLLAGNAYYQPSSYESIATATPTSGTSVTFSSIPSTYTSLQIRYSIMTTVNGYSADLRLNSDSGANYARHYLDGDGATVTATGNASSTYIKTSPYSGVISTYPTSAIIDIHDYASTTKNKTVRTLSGNDNNGTYGFQGITLLSGLWQSTSAVNSLTITLGAGIFASGSTLALYGIKGA